MKLPHESLGGTVAAGCFLTVLLIFVARWLAAGG